MRGGGADDSNGTDGSGSDDEDSSDDEDAEDQETSGDDGDKTTMIEKVRVGEGWMDF